LLEIFLPRKTGAKMRLKIEFRTLQGRFVLFLLKIHLDFSLRKNRRVSRISALGRFAESLLKIMLQASRLA
jgi:hypothetical protein